MKIIVAGSRSITSYEVLRWAMQDSGFWSEYKRTIEIVSGCANGVDALGEQFADRNGLKVHRFPADWDRYKRAAGHIRNREMGDFAKAHGGRLLAIWDGESPGTLGMVQYAKQIGLQHVLYKRIGVQLYGRVE